MLTLDRRLYSLALRLHPKAFRNQFAEEMALDFKVARHTYGLGSLWRDVLGSLARQWTAHILYPTPDPISAANPSLLAGDYVMIRDEAFTPFELTRGLVATLTLLALCAATFNVHRAQPPDHDTASSAPSTGRYANEAVPPPPDSSAAALVSNCILESSAPAQHTPELLLFHPAAPLPSYEVATIKPIDPDAASRTVQLPPGASLSPLSIRRYLMNAYGATYAAQIVGGPDWLNKDAYDIHGKPSADLAVAIQQIPRQNRLDQDRGMQQSLLADRFHLKAHCETRVLPVYELIPAKGGLKITAVPAPPERKPSDPPMPMGPDNPLPPGSSRTMLNSAGLRVLNAHAIKIGLLARIIATDAGDRPIVNHTGFTGYFDITDLTWSPLGNATADSAPDAPSLTVAIERTLGIKLLPSKAPIEVLVIDHIDRPSPN